MTKITAPKSVNLTLSQERFLSGSASESDGGNKDELRNIVKNNNNAVSFKICKRSRCLGPAAGGGLDMTRL